MHGGAADGDGSLSFLSIRGRPMKTICSFYNEATMKYSIAALTLIIVAAMLCLYAQSPEPLNGTWKLNVAKSKWSPAELTPKSGKTIFEVTKDTIKAIIDGVDGQGRVTHAEYSAKFDGKDYPWTGTIDGKPNTEQDAVIWKRINNYTYESSAKLKGQMLTTQRTVVTRDGKTRTNTVTGKNAKGQVVKATLIYEKQ
jgi:hypothetical protein